MKIQSITRCAPATFLSTWMENDRQIDKSLKLNFDLIIEHFNLSGHFCLLHWQARPKFLRRWGLYSSDVDSYYSCDYDKLLFPDLCQIHLLQLNEREFTKVPTAVIHFPHALAIPDGDMVRLQTISNIEG